MTLAEFVAASRAENAGSRHPRPNGRRLQRWEDELRSRRPRTPEPAAAKWPAFWPGSTSYYTRELSGIPIATPRAVRRDRARAALKAARIARRKP